MTRENLTSLLAERLMHWSVSPNRFLLGNRQWIPRWRFQPLSSLEDAFQLLDKSASAFTLSSATGMFTAEVRVGQQVGTATGKNKAATITLAIARANGLDAPDDLAQSLVAIRSRQVGGRTR